MHRRTIKVHLKGFTLMRTYFASLYEKFYRSFAEPCQGFTLIELMIVIAIVAVLSSVGIITYSSAQKTARVAKRAEDLTALQAGLELYKTATGTYPAAATNFVCIPSLLSPDYIPRIPVDPSNGACYLYRSDSSSEYKIATNPNILSSGEMTSLDFSSQPRLIDPAKDGTPNCTVESGSNIIYSGWAISSGSTACSYLTSGGVAQAGGGGGGGGASPAPSAAPSVAPSPSPSPSSAPITIDFESAPNPLNGQYPAGVIDWGSGNWYVSGAWAGINSNNAWFSAAVNSRTFTFITPKKLISMRVASDRSATITLSCSGNSNAVQNIVASTPVTITTNWSNTCTTVTVNSTAQDNTIF